MGHDVEAMVPPIAIHTRLGWVLSGPMSSLDRPHPSVNLVTTHTLRVEFVPQDIGGLDDKLRAFWELESLGITEPE